MRDRQPAVVGRSCNDVALPESKTRTALRKRADRHATRPSRKSPCASSLERLHAGFAAWRRVAWADAGGHSGRNRGRSGWRARRSARKRSQGSSPWRRVGPRHGKLVERDPTRISQVGRDLSCAIRFADARNWLFEEAMPFWAGEGVDRSNGGFVEQLNMAGRDAGIPFTRMRAQCRQIYCFTHAGLFGWRPGAVSSAARLQRVATASAADRGPWRRFTGGYRLSVGIMGPTTSSRLPPL